MSLGIALIIEQRGWPEALRIADYHGFFCICKYHWLNYQFSKLKKQNFSLKSTFSIAQSK